MRRTVTVLTATLLWPAPIPGCGALHGRLPEEPARTVAACSESQTVILAKSTMGDTKLYWTNMRRMSESSNMGESGRSLSRDWQRPNTLYFSTSIIQNIWTSIRSVMVVLFREGKWSVVSQTACTMINFYSSRDKVIQTMDGLTLSCDIEDVAKNGLVDVHEAAWIAYLRLACRFHIFVMRFNFFKYRFPSVSVTVASAVGLITT